MTRRASASCCASRTSSPNRSRRVELFHTFRQRKLSFALIVDEYGGVTGLVTMEDLLECVFGEIASPSDSEVVPRHLVSDLADGRRLIDTSMLARLTSTRSSRVRIESEEVETLAGALLQAFGELPASGATIELCGLRFTVEDIEHNRITRVLVERLPVPVAWPRAKPPAPKSAALPPAAAPVATSRPRISSNRTGGPVNA